MRLIVAFLTLVFSVQSCFGWSEGGHHLIAVMAFDILAPEQQAVVLGMLKSHPRFAEDFRVPENAADPDRWLIGRAGYWPDIARRGPYDRPNWHWQLGSTLVIGKLSNVPENPGPCPDDATLNSMELHIAQAIELNRRILKDKSKPAADRALAICWIAHLVADAHQPCHAGSLYTEKLFPEGDRGANSIKTKQRGNLHAVWDGLLGPKWDEGDINRRQKEIEHLMRTSPSSLAVGDYKLVQTGWLKESAQLGKVDVYEVEVLDKVEQAEKAGSTLEPIDLSENYLKRAGKVAQIRAALAAQRLALILMDDIGDGEK